MPITVAWYEDEQKNIHYDLVDIWTWKDLNEAIDSAVIMLDSVDYEVNLIVDFTNTGYVPQFSVENLSNVAKAPTIKHPNTKKLIMVGADKYIGVVFNVFRKIFPFAGKRYELCADHAALEAILLEDAPQ